MLLLNNHPIDYFVFPGGELQVKLPKIIETERTIITWKPCDASSIILLQLTVNALKNMGISDIDLDVLYLPYARQDRVCSVGEANSLEVICKILDDLGITTIRIFDVHNEKKTIELFRNTNLIFIDIIDIFLRYKILDNLHINALRICSPDDGAYCRISSLCSYFELSTPIAFHKKRCPETGIISAMMADKNTRRIDALDILIIDDICDGGATFNQAAQILKENGALNLYLYVTHGIFSKGLDLLQENFKHIYCHHVLHNDKFKSTEKLTILKEFPHAP